MIWGYLPGQGTEPAADFLLPDSQLYCRGQTGKKQATVIHL